MTQVILAKQKRICDYLEKYVYDYIWNDPYTESRTHIVPELLDQQPYSGFFVETVAPEGSKNNEETRREHIVLLPPSDMYSLEKGWLYAGNPKYFVFGVPLGFFNSVKIQIDKWMTLADFCSNKGREDKERVDLKLYTVDGKILNRAYVYVRTCEETGRLYVAVDEQMALKVAGLDNIATIYKPILECYIDSDTTVDSEVESMKLRSNQVSNVLGSTDGPNYINSVLGLDKCNYATINGRWIDLKNPNFYKNIKASSYFEKVTTSDIIGIIDVNKQQEMDGELIDFTTEVSEKKDTAGTTIIKSRQLIVHIPKEMNPENLVITKENCEFWIVPSKVDESCKLDPSVAGICYSIATPSIKVEEEGLVVNNIFQLTHSDMMITLDVLKRQGNQWESLGLENTFDSVAKKHGFEEYRVVVVVRKHSKLKTMTRTGSYSDLLYALDDKNIVKMITGVHPGLNTDYPTTVWTAENLRKFGYGVLANYRRGDFPIDKHTDEDDKCPCTTCGMNLDPDKFLCPLIAERKERAEEQGHIEEQGHAEGYCTKYVSKPLVYYINALGPHKVLSLVGKRIFHYEVTEDQNPTVVVPASIVNINENGEWDDDAVRKFHAVVYHNGLKLPDEMVSLSSTDACLSSGITEIHTHQKHPSVVGEMDVVSNNISFRIKVDFDAGYQQTQDKAFKVGKIYYRKEAGQMKRIAFSDLEILEDDVSLSRSTDNSCGYVYIDESKNLIVPLRYVEKKSDDVVVEGLRCIEVTDTDGNVIHDTDGNVVYKTAKEVATELNKKYAEVPVSTLYFDDDHMAIVGKVCKVQGTYYGFKIDDNRICEKVSLCKKGDYIVVELFDKTGTHPLNVLRGEDDLSVAGIKINGAEPSLLRALGPKYLLNLERGAGDIDRSLNPVVFQNDRLLTFMLDYRVSDKSDGVYEVGSDEGRSIDNRRWLDIQCASYLTKKTRWEAIFPDRMILHWDRGYTSGSSVVSDSGQPFWFDGISLLSIDGRVCSCFEHDLGTIDIHYSDGKVEHPNGSPYYISTSVNKEVYDAFESLPNYPEVDSDNRDQAMKMALSNDRQTIHYITKFFKGNAPKQAKELIIPKSHKIVSSWAATMFHYLVNHKTFSEVKQQILVEFDDGQQVQSYPVPGEQVRWDQNSKWFIHRCSKKAIDAFTPVGFTRVIPSDFDSNASDPNHVDENTEFYMLVAGRFVKNPYVTREIVELITPRKRIGPGDGDNNFEYTRDIQKEGNEYFIYGPPARFTNEAARLQMEVDTDPITGDLWARDLPFVDISASFKRIAVSSREEYARLTNFFNFAKCALTGIDGVIHKGSLL